MSHRYLQPSSPLIRIPYSPYNPVVRSFDHSSHDIMKVKVARVLRAGTLLRQSERWLAVKMLLSIYYSPLRKQ